MDFLMIIVLLAGLLILGIWLFIARQGDAQFQFMVDQHTGFTVTERTAEAVTLAANVPFLNIGTQDGTIMDAYTRHLLPYEQYDAVEVNSRLELESAPRTDGYFEAFIVPKSTGKSVVVTVKFTAKSGTIEQALSQMVDMPVDIVYQIVARGPWYIDKTRMTITAAEIAKAMAVRQEVE